MTNPQNVYIFCAKINASHEALLTGPWIHYMPKSKSVEINVLKKERAARPGRPALSPLEKARREALKALRKVELIDSEFHGYIDSNSNDPVWAEEIRCLADDRMKAARALCDAQDQLSLARAALRRDEPDARARLDLAKNAEKIARASFHALPELRVTREEWKEPGVRSLSRVGRPKLDIEIRRVRAQDTLEAAIELVKKEEEAAGVEHAPISQLSRLVVSNGAGLGRPNLDELGKLDLKLSKLLRKIEQLKNLRPPQKTKVPRPGPKPTPLSTKLAKTQMEADRVQRQIKDIEQKLDRKGQLKRRIKLKRDERRKMTLAIKAAPGNSTTEQALYSKLSNEIDNYLNELAEIEAQEKASPNPLERYPKVNDSGVEAVALKATVPIPFPNFDPIVVAVNPHTALGDDDASLQERRALALAAVAEIDTKYAQDVSKVYAQFDPETATKLVDTLDEKRWKDRAEIKKLIYTKNPE
jgi:hypothetical protein